jgi:hypothetical protein
MQKKDTRMNPGGRRTLVFWGHAARRRGEKAGRGGRRAAGLAASCDFAVHASVHPTPLVFALGK